MPHAEEFAENAMPHPENPNIDKGKRYAVGTPEAAWYRERYDRLLQIISQRKEDHPMPSNSPTAGYVGGDARYYLSEDESNAFNEASAQVAYAEKGEATERVTAKRAARITEGDTTMPEPRRSGPLKDKLATAASLGEEVGQMRRMGQFEEAEKKTADFWASCESLTDKQREKVQQAFNKGFGATDYPVSSVVASLQSAHRVARKGKKSQPEMTPPMSDMPDGSDKEIIFKKKRYGLIDIDAPYGTDDVGRKIGESYGQISKISEDQFQLYLNRGRTKSRHDSVQEAQDEARRLINAGAAMLQSGPIADSKAAALKAAEMQNTMIPAPMQITPKAEMAEMPAKPRRTRKSRGGDVEQGNGPNITVRMNSG